MALFWERARTRASFKATVSGPLTTEDVEKMRHFGSLVHDRVAAIWSNCL